VSKKQEQPKKSSFKAALNKRVTVGPSGKFLGKDVKAPRWLKAIGNYIKGSVNELKQVKWPNRRATWSFTIAVILFTLAMSGLILALDYGFEQLFKQVIL
jgi:preprotein translocase SecE subunit